MRLFIESTSMWEIIENGGYVPTLEQLMPSMVADPAPPVVVKMIIRNQWTDRHKAKVQMNAKAKYLITYALSKSEYDKIISCDSTKEIQDRLHTLH